METYQTREEIRRRVQARLGMVSNDDQASQILVQMNEWIRAACQEVFLRCAWVNTQRETRVDIGIAQRFVDMPDNATAANILQVAIWDADAEEYCVLRRAVIPQQLDNEPVEEAGGDDAEASRARPLLYQPKTQIELWPLPDIAYELKIDHTVSPELATDAGVSIVDAEAIILWTLADAYEFQGDERLANTCRAKFERRIAQLKAQQHTGETFKRGGLDELEIRRVNKEPKPNYDTRPSTP